MFSVFDKEPSVAEVRAMLDEMFLGASSTLPAQVAKSSAPPLPELAKRPPAINPARPVQPGRPVRPPMPNPPRKAPKKSIDAKPLAQKLGELTALRRSRPATPQPAKTRAVTGTHPPAAPILTKVERIIAGKDLHTAVLDTDGGALNKRLSRDERTLLDEFRPRSFA